MPHKGMGYGGSYGKKMSYGKKDMYSSRPDYAPNWYEGVKLPRKPEY